MLACFAIELNFVCYVDVHSDSREKQMSTDIEAIRRANLKHLIDEQTQGNVIAEWVASLKPRG